MKIKINDKVKVMAGKDKGKVGKVIQIFPKHNKVVVEGVNVIKKHLRSGKKGEKGQVIDLSGPLHASNVMLVDPKSNQPTRVGYQLEGNKKKRISKKSKEIVG